MDVVEEVSFGAVTQLVREYPRTKVYFWNPIPVSTYMINVYGPYRKSF